MGNGGSGKGQGGVPEEWVRFRPDEPDYEILHLCIYLSELPDLTDRTEGEGTGKENE
jgi:hypothetical protein